MLLLLVTSHHLPLVVFARRFLFTSVRSRNSAAQSTTTVLYVLRLAVQLARINTQFILKNTTNESKKWNERYMTTILQPLFPWLFACSLSESNVFVFIWLLLSVMAAIQLCVKRDSEMKCTRERQRERRELVCLYICGLPEHLSVSSARCLCVSFRCKTFSNEINYNH